MPLNFTEKNTSIRILLNRLTGPVNGKTYSSEMPSMAANSNGWIANVISYARYQFGDHPKNKKSPSPVVTSGEVNKIRKENTGRNKAWALDELKNLKQD